MHVKKTKEVSKARLCKTKTSVLNGTNTLLPLRAAAADPSPYGSLTFHAFHVFVAVLTSS